MKLMSSPRIRTTPFHESVIAAGVTDVTVYNKMLLPTSYGDPEAEYRRLTEGVALWDVAAERQVQIMGPDADRCVQYLTARDLSKMKHGQGKYVAMCDHQGRILNDPVLLKLSDRYWFSLSDSDMLLWVRSVVAERGFDVTVEEPDVSPLAIQGPKAEAVVVDLFGGFASDLKFFWFVETELDGIPLVLCRSGWSKQGGFELFLRDGTRGDELWSRVMAAGARYGIGPGAPNNIERVESGLLSWGGDTTPDSNPFEAGMARYVDTDIEADYIGKAALARVAAEGPARLLVGLVITSEPGQAEDWPMDARAPVFSLNPEANPDGDGLGTGGPDIGGTQFSDRQIGGRQIGTMSTVVRSPRLQQTLAIAQIETDVVTRGETVVVGSPDGWRTATIHQLPFIRPGS